ncbi:MAG TPA: SulP family inorganic anion transporter, partial [Methylomirabilota bacterium]|nr:SulP family inorganic anion transporter [Methylomirabilota bacterium]
MSKRLDLTSLKGDLAGGTTSAILTVPVSMGYGVLALLPLGDQYISVGVLAGLYSAIFLPLTILLLGDRNALMYAPRSVVTFLLASVVAGQLVGTSGQWTLVLTFLVILLAGLFQALFGLLRLGNLIRYIPSPVMAGFQNAVAVLMFVSQLAPMLGVPRHVTALELIEHPSLAQPLTFLVGLVTCLAVWLGPRVAPKIPPIVLGLVVGTGAHYGLTALGQREGLGPIIGTIPVALPEPTYVLGFASALAAGDLHPLWPSVTLAAATLAIIASLDALLCAKTVESVTGARVPGNRILARLGVGNMVTACFGGIAGGINLGSTFANHRAGGRTRVSVAITVALLMMTALFLGPVIGLVPRVVIAATLVVVAVQLLDRWSLQAIRRLLSRDFVYWKTMALDLLVVVLVATVTIVYNLVAGVAVGVTVAVLFFLLRMSKSVVRRTYRADVVRSRRTRDPRLMELLSREGRKIVAFELEGPIFFGTAEYLAGQVEASLRDETSYVVLDLKRVNELDSTGARVILQLRAKLARDGKRLLLSHAQDSSQLWNVLRDMGVATALARDALFADTDAALEWAEDQLILSSRSGVGLNDEVPLDRLTVLAGLTSAEREVVGRMLGRRVYQRGDVVIKEGDTDRSLFMISKGTASVKVKLAGQDREKRLASFSPGAVFGEVALLDEEPRSATVTADEELVCYVLDDARFRALTDE